MTLLLPYIQAPHCRVSSFRDHAVSSEANLVLFWSAYPPKLLFRSSLLHKSSLSLLHPGISWSSNGLSRYVIVGHSALGVGWGLGTLDGLGRRNLGPEELGGSTLIRETYLGGDWSSRQTCKNTASLLRGNRNA
ncbi:hypothetical protein Tco_1490800 [Tanacetum coccineum]